MKNKVALEDRVGMIGENKYGSKMVVIEYNGCLKVVVKFIKHGNLVHTTWNQFSEGIVKNPYDKSVYGVGYLGEGEYKAHINGVTSRQYSVWRSMLMRCYNDKYIEKYPAYKDAIVSDEWHNFQTFAKWYDENYYEVNDEKMNLDKDILVKGNKIYSPKTCVFVPARINNLFVKSDVKRGKYPIGVHFDKYAKKYVSKCSNVIIGEAVILGYFTSPEDAFISYKKYKEKLIKQIAREYRKQLPEKLYSILINYIVAIDD